MIYRFQHIISNLPLSYLYWRFWYPNTLFPTSPFKPLHNLQLHWHALIVFTNPCAFFHTSFPSSSLQGLKIKPNSMSHSRGAPAIENISPFYFSLSNWSIFTFCKNIVTPMNSTSSYIKKILFLKSNLLVISSAFCLLCGLLVASSMLKKYFQI